MSRIWTHGCFHIADFQDQHHKPLGHHSAFVNIIALFHSAVNTLEQIFRLELKIKLYKSLVLPLNYICFEFSLIYLCMKSLIRLVPFLPLSWAAFMRAARISPLTLMFIFLSCFKLSIPLKILFPVVFLMWSFPVVLLL